MRRRRPGWIWGGRIAAVVIMAGLAAYLSSVGLDKADKLASVLSLLVAVAALVVPYILPPTDGDNSEELATQRAVNTVVGGHLTQVRDARGVRVQSPATSGPPRTLPDKADPVPEGQGGQCVNGVWVGGNLTQVNGADGDVTIG